LVRELAYSARPFSAAEAEKLGLVSRVVDGSCEAVVSAALDLAKVIAAKSPIAISGTKRILTHARDHSVAENLEFTSLWNASALQSKDLADSVIAAKQKRQAKFSPLKFKLATKL
jgi:delta(3,5)-delta(2,4)-dienoyl-CoA isomerase